MRSWLLVLAFGVATTSVHSQTAEIRWDRYGIPHIFGRNAEDVFYGLGYAQMNNHAEQLLLNVAAARGRYAEYFGAGEKDANVAADILVRTQGIPRRATVLLSAGGARQRSLVRAFVRGVNAYAARRGDSIPPRLRKVLPVVETDPFALWQWTVHFTFMNEGPERHKAKWLREAQPQARNPAERESRADVWPDHAAAAASNGWAFAPSRTTSGNAILMGNPHLDFGANGQLSALPGTKSGQWQWMEAHLVVGDPAHPDENLSGVGFLGMPALTIGFNDFLGWTHTVNGAQSSNVYELALQGNAYRWGKGVRTLQSRHDTVRVCNPGGSCETRRLVIESSIHGPIVARTPDRALALRVAGLDASAPFEQYWDMGRARNYREFEGAFSRLQMPYFNVIYADRDGRILFADAGRIPRRAGGSFAEAGEILKGGDPSQLWSKHLPWESLPKALDPPSGFVQNGNDSPWTSTFPSVLRKQEFPSYVSFDMMWPRSRAGARYLVSKPKVSFDDVVQGKLSTHVMVADLVLEELLTAADARNDESLGRAAQVLRAWDRTSDRDSRGSALFERWWRKYGKQMAVKRAAERIDDPAWLLQYDPAHPLDTPSGLADVSAAVDALKATVTEMQSIHGRLDVTWGEAHRVVLVTRDGEYRNPVVAADVPANGGSDSLGVVAKMNYPPLDDSGRMVATGGEGYMQIVEFTPDGARARKLLVYGNASRPGSRHITDQLQSYVDKQLLPALRTREEVERETVSVEILSAGESKARESGKDAHHVPEQAFAGESRGPYRTGTIEELWIDASREETTTSRPDDRRHLMVQIWYPARFQGDPPRAPYALHRELYADDEQNDWLDDVQHVRTNSVLAAPVAPGKFPLLIYNPGGFHPHFSGTFQTEFLASHGYIVVAIGHTGLNCIERFPDGYVYSPDINDPRVTDAESIGLSKAEWFERQVKRYAERMMPIHVQDIRFVLDRLSAVNATRGNRFHERLNLDQVGSLGWSLGGALSLQASRDEPRVKAAINLDGWLYTDVAESGTHRPVLQMHGDAETAELAARGNAASLEASTAAAQRGWQLYARSTNDWYDVTLKGALHSHFSDHGLFQRADPKHIHPQLAFDIINGYTLEFFDKYLRGRADTPLLSGKLSYPEVELVSARGSPTR